jgi:hypothetical protein
MEEQKGNGINSIVKNKRGAFFYAVVFLQLEAAL